MRVGLAMLLGGLAWAAGLRAQVSVEVLLEQEQFLRDESLPVRVRIANLSGQTLRLGQGADWLTFVVETRDGHLLTRLGELPVAGEFTLDSAMVAERVFDLMPHFDLSLPGRYRVAASVRLADWGAEVTSRPKEFDIIRGNTVWEAEFGLPAPAGPPEVRKYTLQQAMHLKQFRLYARVTDPTGLRVFRVQHLGPLVSFSRPEAHVDRQSQLHVLFQTGARAFLYTVLDPDGVIRARQTHDYTATRPVLRADKEGAIRVVGGQRRFTRTDLPPRLPGEAAEPAPPTNQFSITNLPGLTNPAASPASEPAPPKKSKAREAARPPKF